jgi:hypothetical protein
MSEGTRPDGDVNPGSDLGQLEAVRSKGGRRKKTRGRERDEFNSLKSHGSSVGDSRVGRLRKR